MSQMKNPRRGVIALNTQTCTSCDLCIKQCPTRCMSLEFHQAPDPKTPEGARVRMIKVLDDFHIDFGLCMSCGICVEVCPFDSLSWEEKIDYDEVERRALNHDKNTLSAHACEE